jgi:hypothetical protein
MIDDTVSILNAAGLPSVDFIEEVTDSRLRKKNEVVFAISVNGLPGDPAFGVGLVDMIFDEIDSNMQRAIRDGLRTTLPDLISDLKYNGSVIALLPDKKFVGVDISCTDLESGQEVMTPVAVMRKNRS